MNKWNWIDIEPGTHSLSLSAYEVSKKVINLLRHCQTVQREDDGAVQFWRINENLQNQFPQCIHRSDDRWKACLAARGRAKRRFQYCTDDSGTIIYLRALQGHSGRNLIDPSLQDNVVIQSGIFQHVHHIRCAFNLHSIINSGLIPGGQNSSKRERQYSFCLLILGTRVTRILKRLTSMYHVVHNTCTVHGRDIKTRFLWVDIDIAIRKGLKFYQT